MEDRWLYSPGGIISLSHKGNIIEVNRTFLEEMGYHQEELVGNHLEYLCQPVAKMIVHSYFYPNINLHGHVKELFVKLKHKMGYEVPFLLSARQFKTEGELLIDIMLLPMKQRMKYEQELKQMTKQLEIINHEIHLRQDVLSAINLDLVFQTNTDNLTGVANRKLIQEEFSELVNQYQETGEIFSILLLDIDHFKKVNDTYGHLVGDDILMKVAALLSNFTRGNQMVGRIGGEEFIIILPGTNPASSLATAERMRQLLEKNDWEVLGRLTVSIGVATFESGDTEKTIVRKADEALYHSKNNGRNLATHYDELPEILF